MIEKSPFKKVIEFIEKRILFITGTEKGLLKKKELRQNIVMLMFVGFFVFGVWIYFTVLSESGLISKKLSAQYDRNIAILTIDKEITDPYINIIIEQLEEVRSRKDEFPYLLIVMSSGGGAPQGSSELAHYLKDLQKEIKVVFYINSVAASGAYYIASAMDHNTEDKLSGIIANENSIVGSIGVILSTTEISKVADTVGVSHKDITIGDFKSPVSIWKPVSQEGEQYIKDNLMIPVYKNFHKFVQDGRKLDDVQMDKLTDGRIFIASEVVGTLVDRISYLAKIKSELLTLAESTYPEEKIGFVGVNVKNKRSSLVNVEFNVDNLSLSSELGGLVKSSGSNINMR